MKGNLVNDKLWGFILVILACALILQCAAASASDNSKQAQAKALFQAAYSSSAIGEKGSPPFHLKAQFQYRDSNFQVVSGSYEELWLSSDKSRVSYSVPSEIGRASCRERVSRWTGDWSSDVCSSDLLTTANRRKLRRFSKLPIPARLSGKRAVRRST